MTPGPLYIKMTFSLNKNIRKIDNFSSYWHYTRFIRPYFFYCFDHPRYFIKINDVQQLVYTTNVFCKKSFTLYMELLTFLCLKISGNCTTRKRQVALYQMIVWWLAWIPSSLHLQNKKIELWTCLLCSTR